MTAPAPFDTHDPARAQDLAEARKLTSDLLHTAGSDGMPLIGVLNELIRLRQHLSVASAAITEMLQEGSFDLTADRRLRLTGASQ